MTALPTVRTKADLRARVAAWRAAGERVALVPTMGALHEGHLSLVGIGRANAEHVVASLFVNPTQFSPAEDFDAYPRDEARDAELLAAAGCDLLYAPGAEEMYPPGFATSVAVAHVSEGMEGAARPHHFGGVATVVTKLLTQAAPDVAVFGEKDYQQLQVIRRLTRDLDLPVEIIGGPTMRADDGLALSSRNAYLSAQQRAIAPALNRALKACAQAVAKGAAVDASEAAAIEAILAAGFDSVDYLEVRSAEYLERLGPGPIDAPARVLTAARLGRTRLLDNEPI
ncbi:MAG: pantoate--beta-alanine ligase [Proteobacteria bacterium]|nr:pantoate--beta-alanine ligase [Pseudomonadota bacterium]